MKKLLFLILLFLFSCSKKKIHSPDTLNLTLSSEVSTLDPALSYDGASAQIVYQGYETLFQYDYEKRPYSLIPLLADSMPEISDDKKRYILKIKKGVLYHKDTCLKDKRTLRAKDFITQIKRIAFIPTKSPGWWLFDNKIEGLNEFREKVANNLKDLNKYSVSGLKELDEHTLEIKLLEPYPQLMYALAMSFTSPIPSEAVSCYKNNLRDKIIGTGPYYLKSFNNIGNTILVRNPDYHAKMPTFKQINFHLIKEAQTRWLNFLSKKLDVITLDSDNFQNAVDNNLELNKDIQQKGIVLKKSNSLTYWWLAFNMKDALLGKNKNLRLAIAHAINRDEFIRIFTNNIATKANAIIPPGIEGYDQNYKGDYSYDLNLAKKYLSQAKISGPIVLKFDVRNTSTKSRQMAEFIKKELSKIGIKVDISLNTFPAFLEKLRRGDLQFWLDGWSMDYPDPENSLQLLSKNSLPPGPNASFYVNEEFDRIFKSFKRENKNSKRSRYLSEIQEIIKNDVPWVPLYFDKTLILHDKRLSNFNPSGLIQNKFKYLEIR